MVKIEGEKMSSDKTRSNNTAKISKFDQEKFNVWKAKMKAIVAIKGFSEVFNKNFKAKSSSREGQVLNTSNKREKVQARVKVINATSTHYITFLME